MAADMTEWDDSKWKTLLHRELLPAPSAAASQFISGKTVLVTGAAGSIGWELCRNCLCLGADKVIAFDVDENGLYERELEQGGDRKDRLFFFPGSVRDRARINEVISLYHPFVVFHAAAYKQVPLMENHPREAIKNNVFGTLNLVESSLAVGVESFILVSTDKAVSPAGAMGASKALAEMILQSRSGKKTRFCSVRLTNVIGSRGSVLPLFERQISSGGPLTLTHPEMERYFITVAEAAALLLEAGAIMQGGEIFTADVGEPLSVLHLAENLIRLHGKEPGEEISLLVTEPRPGEKLKEDLVNPDEKFIRQEKNLRVYQPKPISVDWFEACLKEIKAALSARDKSVLLYTIRRLVPTYQPKGVLLRD